MTRLEEASFGRILSRLRDLALRVWIALGQDCAALDRALAAINKDPIYRHLRQLSPPVPTWPRRDEFECLLDTIEGCVQRSLDTQARTTGGSKSQTVERLVAVAEIISAFRRYVCGWKEPWGNNSSFIVPVIQTNEDDPDSLRSGLLYLTGRALDPGERGPVLPGWPDRGSDDFKYFFVMRDVLMALFYGTDFENPPIMPARVCENFAYEPHFNCRIDKGRSHGGAYIAMMALHYLQSDTNSKRWMRHASPMPGTLITGEVLRNGQVGRVEHLAEKLRVAFQEYGEELRAIVPEADYLDLPSEMRRKLDRQVYPVQTVEDLLVEALFPRRSKYDDPLFDVSRRLIAQLSWGDKETIRHRQRPDAPPHFKRFLQVDDGPPPRLNGISVRFQRDEDRLRMRVGFSHEGRTDDHDDHDDHDEHDEMWVIVIDASGAAAPVWTPDPVSGLCLMTRAVHEIVRRIDPTRCETVLAFLSDQKLHSLDSLPDVHTLEQTLQNTRNEELLPFKGRVILRVYDELRRRFPRHRKRLAILSDEKIFGIDDYHVPPALSQTQYALTGPHGSPGKATLVDGDGALSEAAIDREFVDRKRALTAIDMHLEDPPARWTPEEGQLSPTKRGYVLSFQIANRRRFEATLALWRRLRTDALEVTVHHTGDKRLQCPPPDDIPRGDCSMRSPDRTLRLEPDELEAWMKWETPAWRCPECGESHAKLTEVAANGLAKVPVFQSLRHTRNGFVVLRKRGADWIFFATGVQIGEIRLVNVDTRPWWTQGNESLRRLEWDDTGTYFRLAAPGMVLFILEVGKVAK